MNVKVTYYLEVTSSWCHWAEPAWAELKERYSSCVDFDWQIALLGPESLPASRAQLEWFYRRSGVTTASPYMLNPGWWEPEIKEYLAPNCMALAARQFGVVDDRVRLALADAAMRKGRKIGQWEECATVAAEIGSLDRKQLLETARSTDVEKKVRKTTADFHALQVTQRPTFVVESTIGDRAVLSGVWRTAPLAAVIESLLADAGAYASWRAHFGDPPPG